MSKTKIVFYSGIHTIGGVVMSIQYGKDRVILEMGSAYEPATAVYDGTVLKRSRNFLKDSLILSHVPAIPGLYRKEDLLDYPLLSAEECDLNTGVFITHLHLDHMACMGLVSDLVPVYLSDAAWKLERALNDIGQGVVSVRNSYTNFNDKKPIKIGEIEVIPFLLRSQDSYEDYSFYVKTPDMKLHYTGDLQLHGEEEENIVTIKEMEYIRDEKIDVLVCETTSFMDEIMKMIYGSTDAEIIGSLETPKGMLDIPAVSEGLFSFLKEKKGAAVVNFYEREIGSVLEFTRRAEECKRLFIMEPETGYLVYKFLDVKPNVYVPDAPHFTVPGLQEPWFKTLLDNCKIITIDDIKNNPGKYLVQNSYKYILELLDFPEGTAYLHAEGIPIGAFDPAYQNLMRVIKFTKADYITYFSKNYFSHSYPNQVKYYVDTIDPKVLVPSHGFNPERLKAPKGRSQLIPVLNKVYVYDGDKGILTEEKNAN
ncbi:MAG: hypothetical protein FWG77_08405 [Treponema sp.]|nr:hypothetical protein [Treponema sp.]